MQSYTVRLLTTSDLPAAQTLRREVFAPQNPNGSQPEKAIASSNAQQSPSRNATAFPGAQQSPSRNAIASSNAQQSPSRDATAFPGAQQSPSRNAIASSNAQQSQPRDATASSNALQSPSRGATASSNAQQSPSRGATASSNAQQSPSRGAIALPSAQKTLPKNPVEDSLTDLAAMQSTRIYGAFEGETLIGLLEMRNSQISLFFVREESRNQGVGRALLQQLLTDMSPLSPNTPFVLPLNAPADVVSLYARLGFLPSGGARVLNGVRLQPMVWRAERPDSEFVLITPENIANEHLSCIIRTKKAHPGVEKKRAWLAVRLREGHVFRKLRGRECAFIEYAPLEMAWVPILGENFDYIYCLWVQGAPKGRGYGRQLMEACIADARARGRSGVCMLGANQQKAWLSDQGFARKFGFRAVDTAGEYALLALSFDGTAPRFSEGARRQAIESLGLTVYFTDQCPYIDQRIEKLRACCAENAIPAQFVRVASLAQAKALPCAFNNWAAFYNGEFITVNQLDPAGVERLRKKYGV